MVPLRLTVKNFMCYGEDAPPLEFDGIHVACLCGDNGHGKTALLDAVCWALWGTARATMGRSGSFSGPNMGELVRMGQSHMSVELDFAARGQRYRVVRRHSVAARGSSGRTTLELQTPIPDSDGEFRAVSGSSVAETNRRIREILNMDFRTFLNTAYLAQGQADAFTTSAPAERKRCLADALDLQYYQRLSDAANRRGRGVQTDIERADAAIDALGEEAAKKPESERRLAAARGRIAEMEPELESRRDEARRRRDEARELQARQAEADGLRGRKRQAESEADGLRRRIGADERRLASYDAAIADEGRVRAGLAELERAQGDAARMDDALSRKSGLDAKRAAIGESIARAEERAAAEVRRLRHRVNAELRPMAERLPAIERGIAALEGQRGDLARQVEEIKARRGRMDGIAAQQSALEQENRALRAAMEDTRRKFDMLQTADDAECPLCSQRLGRDGQRHLRAEYERAGVESRDAYRRNAADIAALKSEHAAISAGLRELEERRASSNQSIAAREGALIRDREESLRAGDALREETAALSELEGRLERGEFAERERRELEALDSALAGLGYDAEAHETARAALRSLRRFADDARRLDDALANRGATAEALEASRAMLRSREAEVGDAAERLAALDADLRALPGALAALGDADAAAERLAADLGALQVEEGVLLSDIARCEELERRIADMREERDRFAEERGIYAELATAFGKDGIQALAIESAIPQLQDDANDILSRVTENRMHLRLELDEGTSERLEVRIADELGTRDYQMFSGGEAFRIDFALRIALSRLLARRSGAPLPVLFIDEGFGSQDKAGQERLTEAIQSIQDDFEKIIVITHIDEIKQAFPLRIEVSKGAGGSTFRVA